MPFDLSQIPATVAGTEPQPKLYGRSANQRYYDLTQAAQDEFRRTGNGDPLEKINQASVRYTPEGSIAKGNVTGAALDNALGYAEADITHFDKDGDGAIDTSELAAVYVQPFADKLTQLKNRYGLLAEDPQATLEQKQAILNEFHTVETVGNYYASVKAANFFKSVDVRDASGQSDGKLTADELAAKVLFDDAVLDMFQDNHESYETLMNALEAKTDDDGPSIQALDAKIAAILAKEHTHPLAMDGQITADEGDIADALVDDAPIPTNQIVSAIHEGLDLKNRAAAVPSLPQ
jgi:hypothetical protein